MNHSARFWAEVARLCPGYETAEQWLKRGGKLVW
jgi:predicted metal-dependent hydrolase